MARRKGFTVMELLLAVMIVTIVVAMASAGYTRYRDKAAMLVDETNLKVLAAAVKLYAYDHNALPGNLGELRPRDLERAYAQVFEGKRSYTFLAFLEENLGLLDIAEAVPPALPDRYLGENPARVRICPVDRTAEGRSYGLHANAANRPLSWLLDPANAAVTIVGESDAENPTDSDFVRRHEGGKTFVGASAAGVVTRDTIKKPGPGAGGGSGEGGSGGGGSRGGGGSGGGGGGGNT